MLTCTALRWCSRSLSAALRRGAEVLLRHRWARPVLARLLGSGSSPSDSSVACSASGWVEQWLPAGPQAIPRGGILKCEVWRIHPLRVSCSAPGWRHQLPARGKEVRLRGGDGST